MDTRLSVSGAYKDIQTPEICRYFTFLATTSNTLAAALSFTWLIDAGGQRVDQRLLWRFLLWYTSTQHQHQHQLQQSGSSPAWFKTVFSMTIFFVLTFFLYNLYVFFVPINYSRAGPVLCDSKALSWWQFFLCWHCFCIIYMCFLYRRFNRGWCNKMGMQ